MISQSVLLTIVLAPLLAAILAGIAGKVIGRVGAHTVTIAGVALSFGGVKAKPMMLGADLRAMAMAPRRANRGMSSGCTNWIWAIWWRFADARRAGAAACGCAVGHGGG